MHWCFFVVRAGAGGRRLRPLAIQSRVSKDHGGRAVEAMRFLRGEIADDALVGDVLEREIGAPSLCLRVRSERLEEIRDRMSRPGTATTASKCLRLLRFFSRGAEGHRQLVTAWAKNCILTASLDPDGRAAPFALRYSLPWRHVNHLKTAVCSQSDGRVAACWRVQIALPHLSSCRRRSVLPQE